MPSSGHVRALLRQSGFRRLYGTRMAGQFGDGMFQASLAGVVLFSPEREAHPADIALGFAVLLLPYSLIGPFAGVLIDRWWRQRVMVVSNCVRAGAVLGVAGLIALGVAGPALFAAALVVTSINRFFLASLSASLPHVVDTRADSDAELISANAFSTTSGALAAAVGGGVALGLRAVIGDTDGDYALIAIAAVLPSLVSAYIASGFARDLLGPDDHARAKRDSARDVFHGLLSGLRHVREVRPARDALAMIGVQRFGYAISLVCTLLLYRNYFLDDGIFRAELAGLGQVAAAVALGTGLAAVITPEATRRFGPIGYPAGMLVLGAVVQLVLSLRFALPATLGAVFLLALVSQSVKICVDTTVQTQVADEFRGRVFSLYDTLFNVTFVGAAVLTALVLPESGRSPVTVVVIAVGYLAVAGVYFRSAAAPNSVATA
ncbi:MAG: Major Facilitator Superfamily transporter [Pseudonocardiales bacterium]|nr:Major Facilitator Superfamily transporter [Pseudonocardiales bacterium]